MIFYVVVVLNFVFVYFFLKNFDSFVIFADNWV